MSSKNGEILSAMEIEDRNYSCIRGSDLDRDGLFVELSEMHGTDFKVAMEIFYSDKTGKMYVTAFQEAIPLAAVEWVISTAKFRLPPMNEEYAKP